MSATAKTDNGDVEAKLLVRAEALKLALPTPAILDCFAGEGHMYRLAWSGANPRKYLGMDQRFSRGATDPAGECRRGNNELLIKRALTEGPWDLVDLDAYGNGWPLLKKVLRGTTGDRLIVTVTCGIDRAIRTGASDFAAAVIGASRLSYLGLLTRWYDDVIRCALAWAQERTQWQIASAKVIRGVHNAQMRYWLLEYRRKQNA